MLPVLEADETEALAFAIISAHDHNTCYLAELLKHCCEITFRKLTCSWGREILDVEVRRALGCKRTNTVLFLLKFSDKKFAVFVVFGVWVS